MSRPSPSPSPIAASSSPPVSPVPQQAAVSATSRGRTLRAHLPPIPSSSPPRLSEAVEDTPRKPTDLPEMTEQEATAAMQAQMAAATVSVLAASIASAVPAKPAAAAASAPPAALVHAEKPDDILHREMRFRWLCVLLMGISLLCLLFQSTIVARRGPLDANVQRFSRRTRNPPDCLTPAFSAASPERLSRDARWRDSSAVSGLQSALNNKWIHFSGDSTLRDTYYQLMALLENSPSFGRALTDPAAIAHRQAIRHAPQTHTVRGGPGGTSTIRLSFAWSPYVHNVTANLVSELSSSSVTAAAPDLVVMSSGLWHVLYDTASPADRIAYLAAQAQSLSEQLLAHGWQLRPPVRKTRLRRVESESQPPVMRLKGSDATGKGYEDWQPTVPTLLWLSSPSLLDSQLTTHRKENPSFRSAQVSAFNADLARSFVRELPMVFADGFELTANRLPEKPDDGVHSIWAATQTAQSLAAFLECSYPETPVE